MHIIFRQIFILTAFSLLPAFIAGFVHPKRLSWNQDELGPDEIALQSAIHLTNVLWIDARSAELYQEGHIPDALLLNEDAWDELLPSVLMVWNPGTPIVVYCSSLQCQASREVANRLRETIGGETVYVLKGGWEEWIKSQK